MSDFIRTYVSSFLAPTPMIGLLLIVSYFWGTRNRSLSKVLLLTALVSFFLCGLGPLPEWLVGLKEQKYPPLKLAPPEIKHVVVLGGGLREDGSLNYPTLTRTIEGIRLFRQLGQGMLVFTGKGVRTISEAQSMKRTALDLGVPESAIFIETESMNTLDHTKYLKELLQEKRFILVTSALHMPRAMALFKKAGYQPIAAPTGFIAKGQWTPFPQGYNLSLFDAWFVELWSTLWASLKGTI